MKNICVILSANAGVAVELCGKRIWIDALHAHAQPGFSAVMPGILEHPAFQNPEHILFTHCHEDHFSEKLTRQALEKWPKAKVYLPENILPGQRLLAGDTCIFEDGDLTLQFISLPHEGAQYTDVAHFGVILQCQGLCVLAAGDCATASPVLLKALESRKIDVAILDFPWLTLGKGREALKHIAPRCLLACHLPFEDDDICGYRKAAQKSAALANMDVRLLTEPYQQEIISV